MFKIPGFQGTAFSHLAVLAQPLKSVLFSNHHHSNSANYLNQFSIEGGFLSERQMYRMQHKRNHSLMLIGANYYPTPFKVS
jgi:hypothetical protein